MTPGSVAIVGAAESTEMGKVPHLSQLSLHADAALNALDDCGLTLADVDGLATAGQDAADVVQHLGLHPTWVDGTSVGGCSFMVHVRHAVAALEAGLCTTALITHGESGRSQVGRLMRAIFPSANQMNFEAPYGVTLPPSRFTLPVLRMMKETGLTLEQLATVAVVQREWAAFHPRASFRDPITVDDVLSSKMIADPFRLLMCCLVTDAGGALVLTKADRARDFPTRPVYVRGAGESAETAMVSQMEDFTSSRAFRVSGKLAFESAGITHADVDHLMIYDAFAHLPIYGLEDLGFVGRGEGGPFIAEGHTRPGGRLPLNTNGGGLSYQHSGMYGMFALQESVRQMRGVSPAQVPGAKISVAHGVGGMFHAAGTVVLTNEAQL
ncbi:thiolase [Acuticoccus sp. I52.16.1]|uniref:thiolase C-terminal domain-containing protein n=1 Tax=Acuticoccus sp. I52.16.1 TaxID=2928472 RepID=UPI001FD348F6|nr:thiolase [Acuticoccus sp. I52.16.1]UOM33222.1 thiolase [Acuticoccus sp. I52.16.1]